MISKKNIVFDLGCILVGLDNDRCIDAFEQIGCGEIAHYVREHKVEDLFMDVEVGRIDTARFCDEVRRLCGCRVSDADIVWAWNALLTGIPDDKKAALLVLKHRGHRLFLLSNTNFMHWDKCAGSFFGYRDGDGREYGVADYFDRVFLSCAMHLAKPHAEIYAAMLRQAGISAADTLFVDDRADNCRGAESVGIATLHDPTGTAWVPTLVGEQ